MSHFTKVETQINDLVALKKALDQLGWQYQHDETGQGVTVRGYRGQTMKAELCIQFGKYDVGVVKTESGNYELVADWWGIETTRGLTEQEVAKEINAKYAYQRVIAAVEAEGYTVDTNNVQADGTIKLNVSKWG